MAEPKPLESPAQDKLQTIVRNDLAEHGQEFEGYYWAIRQLDYWADKAGTSTKTVSRKLSKPPYDTLRKRVKGRQALLVRIGKPDPNQPSRVATFMAKTFKQSTGKAVTPREYGCLIGLAKDLRRDWQLKVFKHAITPDGWKAIKILSKHKTENIEKPLGETGGVLKLKPDKAHLFQQYPHIPTLRLFWRYAETAFVDHTLSNNTSCHIDDFWLSWEREVNAVTLVDWEPDWKTKANPIFGKLR